MVMKWSVSRRAVLRASSSVGIDRATRPLKLLNPVQGKRPTTSTFAGKAVNNSLGVAEDTLPLLV